MDIERLYQDFHIDHISEGHKHAREGWVNCHCPFCAGSKNYHLGFNVDDSFYSCWRCGWHPITTTLSKLLGLREKEVETLLKQYDFKVMSSKEPVKHKIKAKSYKLPSNVKPLQKAHKIYLEGRGFDPTLLEKTWGLLGTGPISILDDLNYKNRIIIPFIWNGKGVSFDSRDITGKHYAKYMACPKPREITHRKDILYGDQSKWKDVGICVEGPSDVWRFGVRSFAVSGIKFTPKQVRVISSTFKRVPVVFDGGEIEARKQANKLVAELRFRKVDAFRVDIEGDPGGMSQEEANYLLKQLL